MEEAQYIRSAYWPLLDETNHRKTSPKDDTYNCFAYAAHVENQRWDPTTNRWYWPNGAPRGQQLQNIMDTWALLGFEKCSDGNLEQGIEKVVFYMRQGRVEHVARQNPNGKWVSKLGILWDIEHNSPQDLEGPLYGRVSGYMRKQTKSV